MGAKTISTLNSYKPCGIIGLSGGPPGRCGKGKGKGCMIVSTKGRYALRVMIDLAQQPPGQYVPLKEIAHRQGISMKYLEAIVAALAKAGFVAGLRGKGGGYRLTRDPARYTAGSILELTEKTLAPVSCMEKGAVPCQRAAQCPTRAMWAGLDELIQGYFASITLADLANGAVQV